MVQLQFTPFASDDTYHWQTTMNAVFPRQVGYDYRHLLYSS
ncbi:hypothetical protein [Escherichia coli]